MDAVFDRDWVSRLDGFRVKTGANKMELAEALMVDIESFRSGNGCDRLVMVWCGSTEAYREPLILRLVEGMTGPEIAARTGLKHGSVRVNLCRGMQMLREKLGETVRGAS